MKAIVLAAGEGTRLYPLSLENSKVLIPILGKPFIQYVIEELQKVFDKNDIILVINKKIEKDIRNLGVKYIVQKIFYGTAASVYTAKILARDEDVFIINGDNFVPADEIKKLLKYENAIAAIEVEDPRKYGIFVLDKDDNLIKIIEKPENPPSNLANAGVYKFSSYIWYYVDKLISAELVSERGEFEITDAINMMARDFKIKVVKIREWLHLSKPKDIFNISKYFLEKKYEELKRKYKEYGYSYQKGFFVDNESDIRNVSLKGKGIIEKSTIYNTILKGNIFLSKTEVYLSYIENSYICCSSIEQANLKNCALLKNVNVKAFSMIHESILKNTQIQENNKIKRKAIEGEKVFPLQ